MRFCEHGKGDFFQKIFGGYGNLRVIDRDRGEWRLRPWGLDPGPGLGGQALGVRSRSRSRSRWSGPAGRSLHHLSAPGAGGVK